jgi:hypothetical protein
LRREGRRKRKAGAKNEKATFIIAGLTQRSTEKSPGRKINTEKIPSFQGDNQEKERLGEQGPPN